MSGFPPLLLSFLLGRGFLIAPSTLGTPPLRPPASLATIPGGFTLPSPTITTAALVALPLARWLIYSTSVRVSISHSGNMALSRAVGVDAPLATSSRVLSAGAALLSFLKSTRTVFRS